MGNRPRYHCGVTETESDQNIMDGDIDRRTHYGFGMPPTDIQISHGEIYFGRIATQWRFLRRNFQRDKSNWCQVHGPISETNIYPSRLQNARWVAPIQEQSKNRLPQKRQPPTAIQFEMHAQRIHQIADEPDIQYQRTQRTGKNTYLLKSPDAQTPKTLSRPPGLQRVHTSHYYSSM